MKPNISKHITYGEGVNSFTAIEKHIDNTPTPQALKEMQHVAVNVFDKVRDHFGKPLKVSSFYRSPALNAAVGGSRTSQHMAGQAIDIQCIPGTGVTNAMIYNYILKNLEFDQLIWEFGNDKEPAWVHVSLKLLGVNRKQTIRVK